MNRPCRRFLVVALAVVAVVGGCGGGDGDDDSGRPPATLLQMRPVVDAEMDATTCAAPAHPFEGECLELGPVDVDSGDIQSVSSGTGANGPELRVTFTTAGLIKFNKAAADSGVRRVAVLIDGVVATAPAVQGIPLEPEVVLTGHFTAQQIDRLVSAFTADS